MSEAWWRTCPLCFDVMEKSLLHPLPIGDPMPRRIGALLLALARHWPIVARAYDGPDVGPGYLRLTVTADKLVGELVGARPDSFSITR